METFLNAIKSTVCATLTQRNPWTACILHWYYWQSKKAKTHNPSMKISNKHEFLLKLEKAVLTCDYNYSQPSHPQWSQTCFAYLRQPPTVFSSIVCPVPSVTDESLHRVSSSRESVALLVKGINQQKSQQESLQTLLQSLRASQYWQQLQKQREVIPEGFDTPFHQHSHERMLFSSSKCHFNAATVQTLIGIHNLLKCLLTNKKPRLL